MWKILLQAFHQFPFSSVLKLQIEIIYFCDAVALTEFIISKYVKLLWSSGLTKDLKKKQENLLLEL